MPSKWMSYVTATAPCPSNGQLLSITLLFEAHFGRSKSLEDSLAQLNTEHVEVLVSWKYLASNWV